MIISAAITSVYRVIAVWIPVTSVPTSSATVAIATFITDVSSVIKNWPAASITSTSVAPDCGADPSLTHSRWLASRRFIPSAQDVRVGWR